MKSIFKLFLVVPFLFCFTSVSDGSRIQWTDFTTGFNKAIAEGKPAMIDCYTDWCHWCKVMDKKTFSDSGVIERLNNDFIAIKFNPEKPGKYIVGKDTFPSGKHLLMALSNNKPSGYPTFFMFDPKTKQIMQHPGYQDVPKFNRALDQVLKLNSKSQ